MLEAFKMTIHFRTGERETGLDPEFDFDAGLVHFSPREGAPRTARATLHHVSYLEFTATAPNPLTKAKDGRRVTVTFSTGTVLSGPTRPVPFTGGVWFRPDLASAETMFFVPDSPKVQVQLDGAARSDAANLPPPTLDTATVAKAKRTKSAWNVGRSIARRSPSRESSINMDPFEAPTVGELDAFDPSKTG